MLDQAYSRRQFLGLAGGLASIVGLGLVGCGGSGASDAADKGSAAAAESVSGEVTYDGASSFQALVEAAAEKFMDANPDVSVSGSGNGSGKGLTAVAAGTVTIGNSDVFAETKLEADQVKNLVDHEVAVVGMGPVVSKNVTVDDLSLEQLKGIFSGQITNWKEVGGDDATIVVLNRKAGSGTRATFEAAVFGDEAVDFKGDAELDKSGDVQTQMGSTDNAISYLDFSHFDDSKFNAIKVEGVEPKSANVTDDSFKIWATEHMYCSKDADEATKAFLEFMLSDDVQGKLVEEQGFIPVSAMKVVKDASGNKLKLTDKGNGKYTFTMPAGKVEVKATFMEDNSMLNFFYDVPNGAYFYEAVKWAVKNGITTGVGNDLFAPEQPCTRAQIVTFLWRAAGSPEPKGTAAGMTDVVSGSYYEKAVAWAIENGITTGTTTSTFSPDATCTRAQSVTFLHRALKGTASGSTNFTDVASDAFYADAVNWAVANNVTNGTSNTMFSPNADCTRAEIVTFLYRAYQGK